MASFGDVDQMAERRAVGGNQVDVERKAVARAPDDTASDGMAVEAHAERFDVEGGAIVLVGMVAARVEQALDVGRHNSASGEIEAGCEMGGGQPATGGGHDDLFEADAGHLFGLGDGGADGIFGGVGIDDDAGFEAARPLMAETDDALCA